MRTVQSLTPGLTLALAVTTIAKESSFIRIDSCLLQMEIYIQNILMQSFLCKAYRTIVDDLFLLIFRLCVKKVILSLI